MNRIRAWVKSFFGFSRTETNGFLLLLPFMLIILFAEPMYQAWFTSRPLDTSADARLLDSITSTWQFAAKPEAEAVRPPTLTTKLVMFDPNTSSAPEFVQMGFKESMANRIVNYRNKGGKFLVKSDLKKIYGIDTNYVASLYSFIALPERIEKKNYKLPNFEPKQPIEKAARVDINLADTSQLIALKGIGSKLSLRIIKYRDRLGGFISQDQLTEVYGLDSLAIKELIKNTFVNPQFIPRQINVNKANEKELAAIPYIKFPLAKAIVAYRFQHGAFTSVEELKKIAVLDEATFAKCILTLP